LAGYSGNVSDLKYDCSISEGTINSVNEHAITYTAPDNPATITIELTISDQSGEIAIGSVQISVIQGSQQGQTENVQSGVVSPAK